MARDGALRRSAAGCAYGTSGDTGDQVAGLATESTPRMPLAVAAGGVAG
ncbi:hypothetical protein ACFY2R_07945 [Micromonospora olivasterospora]